MSDSEKRSRARWFLIPAGLLLAGFIAVPVAALASGGWHGPQHFGPHHRGPHGDVTVEHLEEAGSWFADHLVDTVDGTDAQRDEIEGIIGTYAPQAVAIHEDADGIHEDLGEALLAEQVDRAEVEGVRVKGMALADRATDLAMDFVVDVANVLTPEQRQAAHEEMQRRHGR